MDKPVAKLDPKMVPSDPEQYMEEFEAMTTMIQSYNTILDMTKQMNQELLSLHGNPDSKTTIPDVYVQEITAWMSAYNSLKGQLQKYVTRASIN